MVRQVGVPTGGHTLSAEGVSFQGDRGGVHGGHLGTSQKPEADSPGVSLQTRPYAKLDGPLLDSYFQALHVAPRGPSKKTT